MSFEVSPHSLALLCEEVYSDAADDLYRAEDVEFLIRQIEINTWAVVFRGTTFNFRDIVRDIRAYPWYDPQLGWCHRGFLLSARAAYPMVVRELERRHAINVAFAGHSKGAAEATICAAWWTWSAMPHQMRLDTFGSPRAGRSLEATLRGVRTRRFVNGRDAVTNVPSPLIQRHVGPAIQLGDMSFPEGRDAFRDHKIAFYVEELALLF